MALHYLLIFGAAVKPDGQPSGTLRRRVEGGWQLGRDNPQARFVVTGGQGRYGPPEAHVMKSLLCELGARDEQIIVDDQSLDTLDSAIACAAILRRESLPVEKVTVCSSPYHNYRCQLLLRLLGIRCERGDMPDDRAALGTAKWLYYAFREAVAMPWDALLILWWRARQPANWKDPA